MKKHMSGFVPINYKTSGKTLLIIGLLMVINNLTNILLWPSYFLYLGIALILLSLYLILVVPKE